MGLCMFTINLLSGDISSMVTIYEYFCIILGSLILGFLTFIVWFFENIPAISLGFVIGMVCEYLICN